MVVRWQPYKDEIIALHKEGKTLNAIRERISATAISEGTWFNPSERSWRSQLKAWGCTTHQRRPSRGMVSTSNSARERETRNTPSTTASQETSIGSPAISPTGLPGTSEPPQITNTLSKLDRKRHDNHWGEYFTSLEKDIGLFENEIDPLHAALQRGEDILIPRLLQAGWDINARAQHDLKMTPLHVAVREGMSPAFIMALLRIHGASINITDSHGNTPLHWAARWNAGAFSLTSSSWTYTEKSHLLIRNVDGLAFFHLALIGYRGGALLSYDLDLLISHIPEYGFDDRFLFFPTGQLMLQNLLDNILYHHDMSSKQSRREWWRLTIFGSPLVPSVGTLTILARITARENRVTIPGTDTELLSSLMNDLPTIELSQSRVEDLLMLGYSLRRGVYDCLDWQTTFDMILQGQSSGFWRARPAELMILWRRLLPDLKNECLKYGPNSRLPKMICQVSKRSLLMKAIEDIDLPLLHQKIHIARFIAMAQCLWACQEENDGRFPLFEAAERGLLCVLKGVLSPILRKSNVTAAQKEALRSDLHCWPELAEAAASEDWRDAMFSVSWRGQEFANISASACVLLRRVARCELMKRFWPKPNMFSAEPSVITTELADMLAYCRERGDKIPAYICDDLIESFVRDKV